MIAKIEEKMYSHKTVAGLKAELKKRNASLTGKKADLVPRLEAYDKNFGIHDDGSAEYLDIEDSIVTPADDQYKDINASTKLPPLTRHYSHQFLGASPDGLLNDEYIIEVKCPFSAKYREITITSVPYLELENGELTLKKRHPYYTQV